MQSTDVIEAGCSINRILVIRPGAIGDTLLTFPALLALRERFPGAEITVVGNRAPLGLGVVAGILDGDDAFGAAWVSDLFGDEPTSALRARLERFDLAIVWMHARDAAEDLAARLEKAGVRRALPLVGFPAVGSGRHLADHLVETLEPLGIGPHPRPLSISAEIERGARHGASPAPLVVFHPGAGARHKRWPAERFAALVDRTAERGCATAITRGPADGDAVAALRSRLRRAKPDILNGLSLDELARILASASLFVGNDSGITHLAALLEVPTLAIFGPFDPAYWTPIGQRVTVVDAGQACVHRADPREGCRRCDGLAALGAETVWEAMQKMVSWPVRLAYAPNLVPGG